MNNFLNRFQRIINKNLGLEIKKFPNKFQRSQKAFLMDNSINVILDVGANVGQFAQSMFDIGYNGKMISFEPIQAIFDKLEKKAKGNTKWQTCHFALGDFDGTANINISALDASSSLLPFVEDMTEVLTDLYYTKQECIEVKQLDSIFEAIIPDMDTKIFLKIDTQGFEKAVLDGAKDHLERIKMVQIELSLQEIYKGELTMNQMITYLESKGFKLWSVEPGFYNPKTYQLLQFDGIFIR
ncbi:FkbM family methyltransferase [Dyadobacter sp. LHD-138]|uniref:FkbM family methyltransferase n=1 Tax=Dyadobacter sp. LHD-138 TaxID=3071413 RepID=UPI0027E11FC3|nr:FkbM family methyltransferase [Dyadobacter sp. LHD-138]MDQ6481883.1 FkbM family methyltransferase [Dyadobacter sp. LHD-138]